MKDLDVIDVSEMPEVVKLIEIVIESGQPVTLYRGEEVVAILTPIGWEQSSLSRRKPTDEQIAAARSAAGGWQDFDSDAFIEQVYRDRGRPILEDDDTSS